MKGLASALVLLTALACSSSPRSDLPREPGPNVLRNGDAESKDGAAHWALSLHFHSRSAPPVLSIVPAPADADGGARPDQKAQGGQALQISFPGPGWNVVRLLQEVPVEPSPSTYRFEGFVRVSNDFEGSIQAILSEKAGLSIASFAKRAWFNVHRPESVFLQFLPRWHRFAVDLPCADGGKTALAVLVEGKGQVWLDEIQLRRK